ncbi:MAG: hypothetical protein SCALA702_28840 [Melioribacteraceae bacterium]|nr:MAG: hypothetical protein SCALA702_28840 [Melioribacteraceae bacterium]
MENNRKLEDELRFVELLKDPVRLFGWAYPYFLVVAVIGGIYYLNSLDTISFNEAPEVILDSADVRRSVEMQKGGIVPAMDLAKIQAPGDLVEKGKELYEQNCASCHASDGMGKGPAGAALNPPPRNFHNADGWTNGRTFPDLYKTLQEGILQNGMAAYEYLPVEDRVAMIHYVRTFADDYPEITDEEVATLDMTYNISKGEVKPNTIPVNLAVQKVIEENKIESALLKSAIGKYDSNMDQGLKQVVYCKKTVLSHFLEKQFESAEIFKTAVSVSPMDLGFKSNVTRLSDDEWSNLYNKLKESIS